MKCLLVFLLMIVTVDLVSISGGGICKGMNSFLPRKAWAKHECIKACEKIKCKRGFCVKLATGEKRCECLSCVTDFLGFPNPLERFKAYPMTMTTTTTRKPCRRRHSCR
ncbi:hypothetical protein Y032_0070g499 [Ancylostoma ceylanicum]|uniref:Uncharacterized protein n=1 Tax=Ancylostoma ceylanicum TaxID=53326 RepID=A0A016TYA7_9BILA|nr:hypothetical protein Y032_0070g499 [Ancylostoma ceylanicum]